MSKFDDLLERLGNLKTTILGLSGAIVVILVIFGIVGKDESGEIVPLVGTVWGALLAAAAGINSLIVLFSKDK